MQKPFIRILFISVFLIFVIPLVVYALNTVSTGYRVNNAQTTVIDAHGVCKKVTNNSNKGLGIFVPTKILAEWNNFRNNLPSGVTLGACCVPSTSCSGKCGTQNDGCGGTYSCGSCPATSCTYGSDYCDGPIYCGPGVGGIGSGGGCDPTRTTGNLVRSYSCTSYSCLGGSCAPSISSGTEIVDDCSATNRCYTDPSGAWSICQ